MSDQAAAAALRFLFAFSANLALVLFAGWLLLVLPDRTVAVASWLVGFIVSVEEVNRRWVVPSL